MTHFYFLNKLKRKLMKFSNTQYNLIKLKNLLLIYHIYFINETSTIMDF